MHTPRLGNAEEQWIPLDAAFLAVELRIYEPDDRMVWEYFLSPLVRVKDASADHPTVLRMPHRVRESGKVEFLPSRQIADVHVSREDIARAAENRFLFDSLAWTALDVGMRRLVPLYAEADNLPVPPMPDRAVEPFRSMTPLEFRRTSREYLDQVLLNGHADMVEPPEFFWPLLLRSPELFELLSPAWLVRRKNKVGYKDAVVSPLFAVKDVSRLPERLRDPWWFERNVRELVSLENDESGNTVLGDLLSRAVTRGREYSSSIMLPGPSASPSSVLMMYAGIEGRQRALLRKLPHERVTLQQTRCIEPACGAELQGPGKPKKHCPGCIAKGRNHDLESRERAAHRDRERRRQRGLT